MSENQQVLKNAWQNDLEEFEIKQYYQQHMKQFTKQAQLKGKISFWRNGVENWSEELDISAANICNVTELYPELEERLTTIQTGEQHSWQTDYRFLCLNQKEGEVLSFDDASEAVASQLIDEKIETWLMRASRGDGAI